MIVIFTVYIFSRIFKKRELSENIYNAKISTFTVSSQLSSKKVFQNIAVLCFWIHVPANSMRYFVSFRYPNYPMVLSVKC